MQKYCLDVHNENAMVAFGQRLAQALEQNLVIYLHGNLGAGKTTFTRGVMQGLGHTGHVKSPTYTLVEPYTLSGWQVYHFDLYRLSSPEELEFIGIRDYVNDNTVCIIEWPEKGAHFLAPADLDLHITSHKQDKRHMELVSNSSRGDMILAKIKSGA